MSSFLPSPNSDSESSTNNSLHRSMEDEFRQQVYLLLSIYICQ